MVSSPPVAGEDLLVEDGPVGAEEGHRVQRLRAIPINKYIGHTTTTFHYSFYLRRVALSGFKFKRLLSSM